MKDSIHDIEMIERYFDNTLTEQETHDLIDRLKKDFEFQKLFDQEKLLVHAIRLQAAKKDLEFLKGIETTLGKKKTHHLDWYYYAAAACIALVALAVWMPSRSKNPEKLFTAYFQPQPNIYEPVLRGEVNPALPGETSSAVRKQAFLAYEQKNYQRASELFSEIAKENKDAAVLILLGNSNLMLGQAESAKKNFQDLIAEFDDLDVQGKWYLSLCYLKTGETTQVRNLLNEIAGTETSYAAKARELLKELE